MVRSSLALGPMARNITRYRRGVRLAVAVLLFAGCGGKADVHDPTGSATPVVVARDATSPDATLPKADAYATLGEALTAIIPSDARVLGFGELHSRTDRAQIKSTLSHFTAEAFPAIAPKLS